MYIMFNFVILTFLYILYLHLLLMENLFAVSFFQKKMNYLITYKYTYIPTIQFPIMNWNRVFLFQKHVEWRDVGRAMNNKRDKFSSEDAMKTFPIIHFLWKGPSSGMYTQISLLPYICCKTIEWCHKNNR